MKNQYFNVKDGKIIGTSTNGNYYFSVGSGSAPVMRPFKIKVDSGSNSQFTIETEGTGYNYDIMTTDGQIFTGLTGNKTITFPNANTDYVISITGTYPWLRIKNDDHKLKEVMQWGDIEWSNMNGAFHSCNNMIMTATDAPDLSNVTDMAGMFRSTPLFNGDISHWDTSNVISMYLMFNGATSFNQDISTWDTSKVTGMQNMFLGATSFNQDISAWDVSEVRHMMSMFQNATSFNQNISSWNVAKVSHLSGLFYNATAMTEDLDFSDPVTGSISLRDIDSIVRNSAITSVKLQAGRVDWAPTPFLNATSLTELILIDMPLSFDIATTALTGAAIDALADSVADMTGKSQPTVTMTQAQLDSCDHDKWLDKNWATIPATQTYIPGPDAFVMKVNSGSNSEFTIPTFDTGYNYTINTSDNQIFTGVTGDKTITFPNANTDYDISITGTFPRIYFNNTGDRMKVREIKQWGDIEWQSMGQAFYGCTNMTMTAIDTPDLSNPISMNMSDMFRGCVSFNQDISTWNTSNVTNMNYMFAYAYTFNKPLNSWDTSNVTNMSGMFDGATAFKQPLNNWNTSNVTNMSSMFRNVTGFNQDIWTWDTSKVTNMNRMFSGASSFNKYLNSWDTSKVTDMEGMFAETTVFNQALNDWDTSKVVTMENMFAHATSYNQSLNNWNTSNVTTMRQMFTYAPAFNNSLYNWDLSEVTNMERMFFQATSFNRPLTLWDTSTVTTMERMFSGATVFNQNISGWNVANVTEWENFRVNSALTTVNTPSKFL